MMMRKPLGTRCSLVLLMVSLALGVARQASAQQVDIKARAREFVSQGLQSQVAGRYDEAIGFYKAAYDLVPHPELLFNLGQAYRLRGDRVVALDYYRKYLAIQPDGRAAREAKEWTEQIERGMREEAAAAAQKFEERKLAERARKAEAEQRAQQAERAKAERHAQPAPRESAPAVSNVAAAPEATPRRVSWRKVAAIGSTLAGAVAAWQALAYNSDAQAQYDDYEKYTYFSNEYDEPTAEKMLDHANRSRSTAVGLGGLAVGLTAVAVVLWVTSPPLLYRTSPSPERSALRWAPVVDGDTTALMLGGSF